MVAGDERRPWARLDAGQYTECFTAQALPTPAARDSAGGGLAGHMAGPRKRPRETVGAELGEQDRAEAGAPVCVKYNRYRGDSKLACAAGFSTSVADAEASTLSRSAKQAKESEVGISMADHKMAAGN